MNPMVNDRVLYLAAGVVLILLALVAYARLRYTRRAHWLDEWEDERARFQRIVDIERREREVWRAMHPEHGPDVESKSASVVRMPIKGRRKPDYARGPH